MIFLEFFVGFHFKNKREGVKINKKASGFLAKVEGHENKIKIINRFL